jgi:steroid delta-isomerase-like uncharacterized protein
MQHIDATETTRQVAEKFMEAVNRHDLDTLVSLMADNVVFENTGPAPDGTRHSGQQEVQAFFEQFFRDSPDAKFQFEDEFAHGDRSVVTWDYTWNPQPETASDPGRVRGVSLFQVRDGKIAAMASYVKG